MTYTPGRIIYWENENNEEHGYIEITENEIKIRPGDPYYNGSLSKKKKYKTTYRSY